MLPQILIEIPVFKSRASKPMTQKRLNALAKGRARVKKDNSCSIVRNEGTEASL